MNLAAAAVDNGPPVASRNLAVAMIDEGNALEEQGRIAEAMARYDAAVHADPQCARAHLNRGNILLAGAKVDEARSAYELAIACDPHYAAAHFNLGNLNYRAGEFERALRNYQAAIASGLTLRMRSWRWRMHLTAWAALPKQSIATSARWRSIQATPKFISIWVTCNDPGAA